MPCSRLRVSEQRTAAEDLVERGTRFGPDSRNGAGQIVRPVAPRINQPTPGT